MRTDAATTVGILGERGSFDHQAARDLVGEGVGVRIAPNPELLVAALERGDLDRMVLPIENAVTGSIHENYDRLRRHALWIAGETQVTLRYSLVARPGASLASVRRVAATLAALTHCQRFFEQRPHLEPVVTAEAGVSLLQRDGPVTLAALVPCFLARWSGASVLIEEVGDDTGNATRYLLLAARPVVLEHADKTSLLFVLRNAPGALFRALGAFASRGLDLTKIESRPLRGRPWEYAFYLDVLGDPRGPVRAALEELGRMSQELRVLGSYPEGLRRGADREAV